MEKSRNEYWIKYAKEKYKRVPLDLKIEDYERLKEYTAEHGETINGFIKRLIADEMNKDKSD